MTFRSLFMPWRILNVLLGLLLIIGVVSGQESYTIKGHIFDKQSGESLIGANVFDLSKDKGTVTNAFGFYSITLNEGPVELSLSYIGYQAQYISMDLDRDTTLNFTLLASLELEEIEITDDRVSRIEERTQMSTVEVPIEQIKKIPALLGEVDVLKALQLLPGVQSGGEGQSGLYVRGGSPDQNLILLDGVPVYNASHLFGFFSVFNADAIKDVKLIKGGFPARYGGRLSSVLDISMKDGNRKETHGRGSIGLVASKFTIEGPIASERTSYIFSARRTYIDLLARPFIKKGFSDEGQDGGTGYYFYDVNAKINHNLTAKDKLYLSIYAGRDKFYLGTKDNYGDYRDYQDTGLGWGNITTALRWNHLLSDQLFGNATLTYSSYGLDTKAKFGTELPGDHLEEVSLEYNSGIHDIATKLDFDYLPDPDHFIKFGSNVIFHNFRPGKFRLGQIETVDDYEFDLELGQDKIRSTEVSLYVEDDFKVGDNLKVNAGLHASSFFVDGEAYHSLQPRIGARYLMDNGYAFKASYATMKQYIHLLAAEGIGLPTDLWLPTTARVRPQDSWQVAIGAAKTLDRTYEISFEAYYKRMNNVVAYKEGSGIFEFGDWQDRVTQGKGEAYGLELFVQKKKGRLSGWVGYTLAWSKRQFADLNFGEKFPYRYDRRHDISLVGLCKLSERISFSGTWIYGAGNAVTLANSRFSGVYEFIETNRFFSGSFFPDRNNFRMAAYHRMDLGVTFTKKKKNYTRTWAVGAYNTYNRKNPFFIYEDYEYINGNSEFKLKQASLFPIIPYVTYSIEF